MGSLDTAAAGASSPPSGAAPRTNRKTYTVSKAREKWTDEEHAAFVQALEKRGRNWKAIVQDIGTRSVAQVRSHAQKYFLRLEKEGRAKEIPQPRPKKRASHPYPVQARADAFQTQPLAPSLKARKVGRGRTASGAMSGTSVPSAVGTADSEAASALAAAASQAEADANFSKLYAIVGSMFDSSVSLPEQLTTIEHLPAEQREPLLLMLGHLTANLRETVKNQQPAAAALPLPRPLQWGLPITEQQTPATPVQKLRLQRLRARK